MHHRVSALQPLRLASSRRARRPLINLTPLIDVVFILLIFFMLASSFLDLRSIALTVPADAAAGSSTDGALLIEVGPTELRLADEAVSLDGLAARVRGRLAAEPGRRVLVRPAPGVALQRVVHVLDTLAAGGVSGLSLVRGGSR